MRVVIKRKEGLLKRLVRRIKKLFSRKLLKNKLYGILLILIGYLTIHFLEGDYTVFIFLSMMGLAVFFDTDNAID